MTEKIQKDCEECSDLFEPVGYEGILNATVSDSVATCRAVSSRNEVATETETELRLETERHCGTCEKALPDGTEGCDEHGVNHVWSSHREEWIPDVSDSVATWRSVSSRNSVSVSVATSLRLETERQLATETETELRLETERRDVSDSVASSAATDAATDTETDKPTGVLCDECGETTTDYERITEENWEFCAGLQKQFCGACREVRQEPPCDDPECDADVCYDKREEEND